MVTFLLGHWYRQITNLDRFLPLPLLPFPSPKPACFLPALLFVYLNISHRREVMQYLTSEPDLSLALSSIHFLQTTGFHSYLWRSSTPLYTNATFSLSICQLMDTQLFPERGCCELQRVCRCSRLPLIPLGVHPQRSADSPH